MSLIALAAQYGPTLMKHAGTFAAGYDWLAGKRSPTRSANISSAEQNYLKFMQSKAKTGLGQDVINQQMGNVSRAAHQGVDVAKANIMGGGIAQGIEGSGVMAEQGVVADSAATLAMATAARSIADKNRQVKDQYEAKLGQYGVSQTNQRYQEVLAEKARKKESFGAFASGASGIASDFLSKQEIDETVATAKKEGIWEKLSHAQQMQILMGGGFSGEGFGK